MRFIRRQLHVVVNHEVDQFFKGRRRRPAEVFAGFGGVAEEEVDFGGAEVAGVDLDEDAVRAALEALFGDAGALPVEVDAGAGDARSQKSRTVWVVPEAMT